jgi:hypothetical protein
MNVYEKLVKARLLLQSKGLKQNGKNDYAKYSYFELSDILPECNKIADEVKAVCQVTFDKELAILFFIDCEKPEDKIIFSCPMSSASLKGCHEVQNDGAVQTYLKRYLYQNCFEIAETDALDRTQGQPQGQEQRQSQTQAPSGWKMTEQQSLVIRQVMNGTTPDGLPVFNDELKKHFRKRIAECKDNVTYQAIMKDATEYAFNKAKSIVN